MLKKLLPTLIAIAALAAAATGCTSVRHTFTSLTSPFAHGSSATTNAEAGAAALPEPTGAEIPSSSLTPLQTETLINKVIFGRWTVADAGGHSVAPTEEGRPYVVFDSTAVNPFILKVYAFAGCNTLNGRLALTDRGRISRAGEFAATMKMCPDADSEADIFDALSTVERYRLERIDNNYILYFYNAAGSNTMVLRKSDMAFLDGAWDVTRIPPIEIKADDMPEPMQLVFDLEEGRLHGNTGCNTLNATISTDIAVRNSLTISDPATTRMACPNAGLEQQLVNALTRVARAERRRRGNVDLLDAAGNTVITLHRANLTND